MLYRPSQRGLKVWFRDEVENILRAIALASLSTYANADYRAGVIATLRAVAAAFSVADPVPPSDTVIIDAPGWHQ